MPKNAEKLVVSALQKASKNAGAGGVPVTSKLETLKKLVPFPQGKPRTSPISKSTVADKHRETSLGLADKFVLQLNRASAKTTAESVIHVQKSCAEVTREISSILPCNDELDSSVSESSSEVPDSNEFLNALAQRKKVISRSRKQKIIQKNMQSRHFIKLMSMCVERLDVESTMDVFSSVEREADMNDYSTLIKLWMEKIRKGTVVDTSGFFKMMYQLFISMSERGFQILEDIYGPFLMYVIDMKMKEEFQVFSGFIKEYDHESLARIGYYEMLFWIKVGDECKIRELCNNMATVGDYHEQRLAESCLLALCQSDRKEELVQLLEAFDMRNISSLDNASCIFKSLGRLQLENFVGKFIFELQAKGAEEKDISSFIYDYSSSIPNLAVEAIFSKFEKLHKKVEVVMAVASCDNLIKLSCHLSKVQTAIDIAERVCQSGLVLPIDSFHPILHACERCNEFDLVHQVYSVICHHNVKPIADTFRSMIILHAKMKDYEGAYKLLNDARKINVMPTAGMYNAIMVACIREKNSIGALTVLRQMEDVDIEPDSETYSYLISNCENEKDIEKYHDEMRHSGVQLTKYVYMALIHAYANFGKFEMAKQVLLDSGIQSRHLNEIKSVLVSALSCKGQISDALHHYDEIKRAGGMLEPKACVVLIEHLRTEGNFDRLEQLLKELSNSSYWFDGCGRVIQYCVRYNLLSSAIELLIMLKEKDESSTYIVMDQVFHEIWAMEPTNLEIGLELLRAIKEELHLFITRISLDFLLSTCVKAKDPIRAQLIWSEYKLAGLPYNALTFLRMYQALSAGGDNKAASKIVKKIPKEDPHVCYVIESIKETYGNKNYSNKKGFIRHAHQTFLQ